VTLKYNGDNELRLYVGPNEELQLPVEVNTDLIEQRAKGPTDEHLSWGLSLPAATVEKMAEKGMQ